VSISGVAVIAAPSFSTPKELKVKSFALSPYDQTLYLDCDVYALAAIDEIWSNLSSFGLYLAKGMIPTIDGVKHGESDELAYTLGVCPSDFPHYNSGVVLWSKSSTTDALWASWAVEWDRFKDIDELALARALKITVTKAFVLDPKFNLMVDTSRGLPDGVLWHDGFTLKLAPTLYPELFV
jgi:hypothetical protein